MIALQLTAELLTTLGADYLRAAACVQFVNEVNDLLRLLHSRLSKQRFFCFLWIFFPSMKLQKGHMD